MKIRVVSDLHVDVNESFDLDWSDKRMLTIIAGDIAGSLESTKAFLRPKLKNVIFIAGNHIVYNYEKKPIQTLYQELQDEFPISSNIAFLQDAYKIVDDTVFIGATLWTDYSFNNGMLPKDTPKEKLVKFNMEVIKTYMNDYRWGICLDENGKKAPLEPKNCAKFFAQSLDFIQKTYDKFADTGKKIVLVVHHGVSPKVLGKGYTHDEIASAYMTDLESYLIDKMPKLSLIVHGHIHISCAYKIGEIPVFCNARGYENIGQKNVNFQKDLVLEI